MLHSRLRPISRRNVATSAAPVPDIKSEDPETISDEEEPEDVFGAFISHLFPDDTPTFHGDPGQHLLYSSPRYGELEIMVPAYPAQDNKGSEGLNEGRKLFAHFLWSSGMVVAEGIESADTPEDEMDSKSFANAATRKEAREIWGVRGESVMELGAGAALPSLICALANASNVTVTDHPSSTALTGAMEFNMTHNMKSQRSSSSKSGLRTDTKITIHPHEWGVTTDSFAQENKGRFSRIIAADCYWMPEQHQNLCKTMQWFLAPGGRVWVVSSLHTGRAVMASFFETAVKKGLTVDQIWERDLVSSDENGGEIRREWVPIREGEGPENRRRWCIVAVLKRKDE